jgi:hypothetical protein
MSSEATATGGWVESAADGVLASSDAPKVVTDAVPVAPKKAVVKGPHIPTAPLARALEVSSLTAYKVAEKLDANKQFYGMSAQLAQPKGIPRVFALDTVTMGPVKPNLTKSMPIDVDESGGTFIANLARLGGKTFAPWAKGYVVVRLSKTTHAEDIARLRDLRAHIAQIVFERKTEFFPDRETEASIVKVEDVLQKMKNMFFTESDDPDDDTVFMFPQVEGWCDTISRVYLNEDSSVKKTTWDVRRVGTGPGARVIPTKFHRVLRDAHGDIVRIVEQVPETTGGGFEDGTPNVLDTDGRVVMRKVGPNDMGGKASTGRIVVDPWSFQVTKDSIRSVLKLVRVIADPVAALSRAEEEENEAREIQELFAARAGERDGTAESDESAEDPIPPPSSTGGAASTVGSKRARPAFSATSVPDGVKSVRASS